jgi:RNA polymerase sigma factor (sigma-70 family)
MVNGVNIPDDILLDLIRSGNTHAYTLLYERYYEPLQRKAFFILKDEMEAEDLVQSFFIEVWSKKLYRQIHTSMEAYLHTAIYHKSLNLLEKRQKVQLKFAQYANDIRSKADASLPDLTEPAEKLHVIIRALPIRRLQVFTLVCLEEKKYKEVAHEMGISINSVKTHLKLALKVIRENILL